MGPPDEQLDIRALPDRLTVGPEPRVAGAGQRRQHSFIRSESGFVLVDSRYRILFADLRAEKILNGHGLISNGAVPSRQHHRTVVPLKLPAGIPRFLSALKRRQKRPTAHNGETIFAKTIVRINGGDFTLRAFMIPGEGGRASFNFFLLLEKRAVRSWRPLERSRSYYQLSPREFELIQLLADGLTNKEISTQLKISEWTVKEYLRNIMNKTHAGTRAGVVARVLSIGMKMIVPLQVVSEFLDFLDLS